MIKSADRVLDILEITGSKRIGITHGVIAKELNIPKGSLTQLLSNLVSRNYLSFEQTNKLYKLGPQLLILTGEYLSSFDVVKVGQPIIRELVDKINESAEIVVLKESESMIVCKEDCDRPLKRVISIGDHSPAYSTAGGKAILSYLPKDEMDHFINKVKFHPTTKKTITDAKSLIDELNEIQSNKLAYGREERYEGIVAMAAPVFNLYGRVVASVVVTIPTVRFTHKKEKKIEIAIKNTAKKISQQIGYNNT